MRTSVGAATNWKRAAPPWSSTSPACARARNATPATGRARTLLNDTFRKEKLARRLAVLQAAAWLIAVLERLSALS